MARTAGRKMPGIVKIAMLAFLLYAVVTIVSLRSQIAGKQAELESLSLRVQNIRRRMLRFRRRCSEASPRRTSASWRATN